jgi:hypothetical protein
MDSAWFAVDRDGHVAYFSTGEAGAMPEVGMAGEPAEELRGRLHQMTARTEVVYDPGGHILPGHDRGLDQEVQLHAQDWPILVFLTSLAPVQSDIEAGRAVPVRATTGYAVAFSRLTADQARRLNEAGVVVTSGYDNGIEVADDGPARFGVFEYGHLCENWIAGPYGRERLPARPLHVDQLPPGIRQQLKEATLADRSFAETPHIQPIEHWECHSWDPAWQAVDGTTHGVDEPESE